LAKSVNGAPSHPMRGAPPRGHGKATAVPNSRGAGGVA
jgi:hypothetical protein